MLSQRTRYAIRALLHLADGFGKGPVQLTEIAVGQNIPPAEAEQQYYAMLDDTAMAA